MTRTLAAAFFLLTPACASAEVPPAARAPDAQRISRAISDYTATLATCYERALRGRKDEPELRLRLSFLLPASGRPTAIDSGTGVLGRCVRDRVAAWRFPDFVGEPLTIRVPLVFKGA